MGCVESVGIRTFPSEELLHSNELAFRLQAPPAHLGSEISVITVHRAMGRLPLPHQREVGWHVSAPFITSQRFSMAFLEA